MISLDSQGTHTPASYFLVSTLALYCTTVRSNIIFLRLWGIVASLETGFWGWRSPSVQYCACFAHNMSSPWVLHPGVVWCWGAWRYFLWNSYALKFRTSGGIKELCIVFEFSLDADKKSSRCLHLQWQCFGMLGTAAALRITGFSVHRLRAVSHRPGARALLCYQQMAERWLPAVLSCFFLRERALPFNFCHSASYGCPSTRTRLSHGPFLVRFRRNGRLVTRIFGGLIRTAPPQPLSGPFPLRPTRWQQRHEAGAAWGRAAKWRRAPLGERGWVFRFALPVWLGKAGGATARRWNWRLSREMWVQSSSPCSGSSQIPCVSNT